MKVLVTGGGGFLGTHIIKQLLSDGHQVVSLSRNIYPHIEELGVSSLSCDLSKADDVNHLDLEGFDAVIHTAALAGVWGDKLKYENINFVGSINLLKKAQEDKVRYFIYTSSPSVVFGKEDLQAANEDLAYPNYYYTDYARTKAMAEKEILKASCDDFMTLSIRPHLIWGPEDPHLIPRILSKAKEGKLKRVGDGENLVDIIYVENAAFAHVQALKALFAGKRIGGNAYFVGQERPVNLWQFINEILAAHKLDTVKDSISFKMAFRLGYVFEILYRFLGIIKPEPPMTRFIALQLAKNHYFSHDKAKNDFNYYPMISIEEGLKRTFQASLRKSSSTV